ncbi:MAG: DEAD/DEAH box helicase [Deltaproteobacteria bacterium CG11_big_fil_rev_8_21_14_0_20_47_16]|nr:MAG: DEAD/DEAH box helicase [Deltaproteobacteria bacterium CG11_big_fil_rev_8_21_14_0_20_47_16]
MTTHKPHVEAQPLETTPATFDDLGLAPDILKAIKHVGYTHPTPVQQKAIPAAVSGKDLIACAQTGTGKTAAFCLPMAQRLTHGKGVRGLVLCPTREIALQTKAFLDQFGKSHHLRAAVFIGGVKMGPQIQAIRKHPDIIIATPGRLWDLVEQKIVKLDSIEELVFDEADRMLDMGFLPQIQRIMKVIPAKRHTMMFSATMAMEIQKLAQNYLKDPEVIKVARPGTAAAGITHRLFLVEPEDKIKALTTLIKKEPGSTLVFVKMRRDADRISTLLSKQGFPCERIHSDLSQAQRVRALDNFKKGKVSTLVGTDIAARGLDIAGITHVINFNVPPSEDDYVHRAGRTARASRTGISSTIGTWMDINDIRSIEKLIGMTLPREELEGIAPYKEIARAAAAKSKRTVNPRFGSSRNRSRGRGRR